MNKNLLWKLLFIVGTMLFFLFGIFGIPKGFSGEGLLAALTDHIHLGLDLKRRNAPHPAGACERRGQCRCAERHRSAEGAAANRKIDFTDITQPDPQNNPDHIVLKGFQPGARSDLLSIVQDRLPEYDITGGPTTPGLWR